MATITNKQLAEMRREFCTGKHPNFTKATLNAAFQGYEDYLQTTQMAGKAAVDAATSPYSFSVSDLKKIGAIVFKYKYGEDS